VVLSLRLEVQHLVVEARKRVRQHQHLVLRGDLLVPCRLVRRQADNLKNIQVNEATIFTVKENKIISTFNFYMYV
jgi:cobalamin biosynthesis protein CobD/CbiB